MSKFTLLPRPFCGQTPLPDDPDCIYPITRPDKDGRQVWRAGCIECAGGCGAEWVDCPNCTKPAVIRSW